MFKKILLVYDGSAGSKEAANQTAEIAHSFGAVVTVLTVGGPLIGAATLDTHLPNMDEHEYERIADEGLAILAQNQVRGNKHFV